MNFKKYNYKGEYKMLNNIISELKNLKGTEVKIFGQSCNYPNEVDADTIDTIDILENLLPYEISNQFAIYNYLEEEEEEEEILQVSFEEYCEIEEYGEQGNGYMQASL